MTAFAGLLAFGGWAASELAAHAQDVPVVPIPTPAGVFGAGKGFSAFPPWFPRGPEGEHVPGMVDPSGGIDPMINLWNLGRIIPRPFEMWEDENYVHIEVELPGIDPATLKVVVHDGQLSLQGDYRPQPGRDVPHGFQGRGGFALAITLPASARGDVKTRLTDGILHLTLSKRPQSPHAGGPPQTD